MNTIESQSPKMPMMSPAKVADYLLRLETKLGRCIERATILPGGGIEFRMPGNGASANPADLVDMNE